MTEEKKMGIDTAARKNQGTKAPGDAAAAAIPATTPPAGSATASEVKPVTG